MWFNSGSDWPQVCINTHMSSSLSGHHTYKGEFGESECCAAVFVADHVASLSVRCGCLEPLVTGGLAALSSDFASAARGHT